MDVKRKIGAYFDTIDTNKDGYVTFEELKEMMDNLVQKCQPAKDNEERMREQFKLFWGTAGFVPGKKMTKEEMVDGLYQLSQGDIKRKASGQETIQSSYHKAMFDVIDANNDGRISVAELKKMMQAWGHSEAVAVSLFELIDVNKNGKIEIAEFIQHLHEFWWEGKCEDSSKGVYGKSFE